MANVTANQWWSTGSKPKPRGASEAINAVRNNEALNPAQSVPGRVGIGGQMPPISQPLANDVMAQAAAIGGLTPEGLDYEPPPQMTAGEKIRATGFGQRADPTVQQRAAQALKDTGSNYDAIGKLMGPNPYVTQQHRLAAADMKGMANSGLDPFAWEKGVAHDPREAMAREWAGPPGNDPFAWERGVAHDPHAANAAYWESVKKAQGPYGGNITPAWKPTPHVAMAAGVDPMAAAMGGAAEAAAGGRMAGIAKGAMGMFGGPAMLGAFGVLNNAVDLSDPNSVMRKAIHEGNYGTALARGAVNFIPFGGTIWDNLTGNTHPQQPTVNDQKPQQAADPNAPLDLTDLFPGDPYKHGDFTSRREAMDLYKMQKQFEDKPQVAAAKNQMRALSRDVALAKASGDKTRFNTAMKNYMEFERLLALGQGSYPYLSGGISTPDYGDLSGFEGY